MSSFSVATLQEKLSRLSASQESIETLSLWIIHHKAFAKTSVTVWADSFTVADPDHRLVLLYLANDILQNGRRKGALMFSELFREPLEQVVPYICGQKIQSSVERMFRIWRDRKVYDKAFVRRLDQLLSGQSGEKEPDKEAVNFTTPPPEPLPDFKLSLLEDAIQELRKFKGEMRVKEASVESLPMEVWDASSLGMLKDKSEGNEFSGKFDKAWDTLKEYCDCLAIEVSERVNLSTMLASSLAQQTSELTRVKEHIAVYKTLMAQLSSCREKLGSRQKDLERAQQTATSDPSCKEDLTEVGDMEIDSDEETMETQLSAPVQAPAVPQQLPPSVPHPSTFPPPPKIFNSVSSDTTSSHLINTPPHTHNTASQMPPQIMNSSPHVLASVPSPQMMNTAPQMVNSALRPPGMPYSLPPIQGYRPHAAQFPRSHVPLSAPQSVMQRMPLGLQAPPSGPPHHLSSSRPLAYSGGPPPTRGLIRPPHSVHIGPPRMGMVVRPRGPLLPSGPPAAGLEVREHEPHIEAQPVLYETEPAEQKSSLDDRLQSLVVNKSLGSVLLQEYADSEESGDKPYTPTTTPLPASPGDDESVTTPTPQFEMSPVAVEDGGAPPFNPANPIMKALYHSPTHSPDDMAPATDQESSAASGGESEKPSVEEGSLLAKVDTGMLQNILKNVQGLKQPATTSPPSSSPARNPSEFASPPKLAPPIQTTPTTPPPSTTPTTTTTPSDKPKSISSAANIKITSSLTSLLDEIFPQLSKSLQERKRKQETATDSSDATDTPPVKQTKVENLGSNDAIRPPAPLRLNGPPTSSGGFPPRGPMVMVRPPRPGGSWSPGMVLRPRPPPDGPPGMILRPPGPRPEGPPGMILRPQGLHPPPSDGSPVRASSQQLPPEGMRPRGPPFEGNFRHHGPPRLEGNFRPPRPGMQLVGDRFQGPRPPFRLRNPNSGVPPHPGFPPGPPFPPRGPPAPRPAFGPGSMQPPPISDSGMEPNHFAEKPPQTHDSLQSIPPPGMGMWP